MMAASAGEQCHSHEANSSTNQEKSEKNHANVLLQRLNVSKEKFCDFILIVEEERFPVHKIIMAAASDFIGALLNSDMKEQQDGEVTLDTLDVVGVRAAVNFIYSGKLVIDPDITKSVVKAASFLQIPTMIDAIIAVFRDTLCTHNCFNQLSITDKYSLDQSYLKAIISFISENFKIFSASYFEAFSLESMVSYLTSNKLKVASELELVILIQVWMMVHRDVYIYEPQKVVNSDEEPWVSFRALMTCVRWSLIPPVDLYDKLDKCVQNIMSQMLECTNWLLKANMYNNLIKRQPMLQDSHSQVRGEKGLCVLACDGCLEMYDVGNFEERQTLPQLPTDAHSKHSPSRHIIVSSENGYLYVACGYLESESSDTFYRYDPRFDSWCELQRMTHTIQETDFYLAFHRNNKLYVTHAPADNILSECYDIETNKWVTIDEMPIQAETVMYAGCLAGSSIYVSGGEIKTANNGVDCKDRMVRYDTVKRKWDDCADMSIARSGHVMESLGDFIYVFGGGHMAGDGESWPNSELENRTERYSMETDQWTVYDTELAIPVISAHSFTLDNGIYIIGGYTTTREETQEAQETTDNVQYFTETLTTGKTKILPYEMLRFEEIRNTCLLTTSAYRNRRVIPNEEDEEEI